MMIAEEYLKTLKRKRIDTLILGCTHYPLLKGVIQKVMGSKVILIDSAQEVAAETKMILRAIKMDRCLPRKTKHQFLISDKPQEFKKIARNFLGCSIPQVRKVT